MIRAVIFDLDDTLISEKRYIESGYHHISKLLSNRYGENVHDINKLLIGLFNESPKNVFNRLFDSLGIIYTENDINELVKEYRNHFPYIEFYDDVLPCLETLRKKEIKLGIITDGYASTQHQKLKALKAVNYFDEIIITDELGRDFWKPHPKAFEIMKQKLNLEYDHMIYIGDNPEKDFYISSIYPIRTMRVQREGVYSGKGYLNDIRETYSINCLAEISLLLEEQKR